MSLNDSTELWPHQNCRHEDVSLRMPNALVVFDAEPGMVALYYRYGDNLLGLRTVACEAEHAEHFASVLTAWQTFHGGKVRYLIPVEDRRTRPGHPIPPPDRPLDVAALLLADARQSVDDGFPELAVRPLLEAVRLLHAQQPAPRS